MTEFSHRLRVRYSECDQQGIVFNAHYLSYYDVALTELFRAHGWAWNDIVALGGDLVVAEVNLRYLGSARFDQLVDIHLPVGKLGNTSMTIEPLFRVQGKTLVEGVIRHVFVDPNTLRPKKIPDAVRNSLGN